MRIATFEVYIMLTFLSCSMLIANMVLNIDGCYKMSPHLGNHRAGEQFSYPMAGSCLHSLVCTAWGALIPRRPTSTRTTTPLYHLVAVAECRWSSQKTMNSRWVILHEVKHHRIVPPPVYSPGGGTNTMFRSYFNFGCSLPIKVYCMILNMISISWH